MRIALRLSGRIRRVDAEGVVSTVAGGAERGYVDGEANKSRFENVFAVVVDEGGQIYVAELGGKRREYEYRIRVVAKGRVRTLARIPTDGVFRK